MLAIVATTYIYMSVSVERDYTATHVEIGTNYKSIFSDKNTIQLPTAIRLGIDAQDDESNIAQLVNEGKLVKLHSCRYYIRLFFKNRIFYDRNLYLLKLKK